jgi:hypothetical protein
MPENIHSTGPSAANLHFITGGLVIMPLRVWSETWVGSDPHIGHVPRSAPMQISKIHPIISKNLLQGFRHGYNIRKDLKEV